LDFSELKENLHCPASKGEEIFSALIHSGVKDITQEWYTPHGRFGSDIAPLSAQRKPFSQKWGTESLLPAT
jgi:hypothetical protein